MFGARLIPLLVAMMAGCASSAEVGQSASALDTEAWAIEPLTLIPAPGSQTAMSGELVVFAGALRPPNPCGSVPEGSTLVLCGVLHNPDGEPLMGASVVAITNDGRQELDFNRPPNPCLTYHVRAVASVDWAASNPGPPDLELRFTSTLGDLVAVPNGPEQVGGVNEPKPGSPDLSSDAACTLSFDVPR